MATPINNPFKASLLVDGCSSLEVSCDCKKITFKDTSNYATNDLPGHESADFTSRTITITRGDGSTYIMATSDIANRDFTIPPHSISNNTFSYSFTNTDEDGLWKVELCTYPNWQDDVLYQAFLKPIVLRNGVLYQAVGSSTNVDPALDTSHTYWSVYTDTSDCSDTRYCTSQTIVITCISIEDCYRKAVADAFCGMQTNPCKDMCDNKSFMKAMKMRITMDGLEFAACAFDYVNAQKHMDILKSLCCCN